MTRSRAGSSLAFTLVELLVVMGIITILAGLTTVAAVKAVQRARATYCLNNIRQLGVAELGMGLVRDTDRIRHCPAGPPGDNYGRNRYVSNPRSVSDAARTVLIYESKGALSGYESDVDLRHMGGSNFTFCDGHAKWHKEIPPFKP